jgi:hypothetical protein
VLAQLDDHLRKTVGDLLLGPKPLLDVQTLVRDAWQYMRVLENYPPAPAPATDEKVVAAASAAAELPTSKGGSTSFTKEIERWEIPSPAKGSDILLALERKAQPGSVLLTIETSLHHMAVRRDQPAPSEPATWIVVETERLGAADIEDR